MLDDIFNYILCREHKKILEQAHVRNIDQMHKEEFVQWFERHVSLTSQYIYI